MGAGQAARQLLLGGLTEIRAEPLGAALTAMHIPGISSLSHPNKSGAGPRMLAAIGSPEHTSLFATQGSAGA